MSLEGGHVGVKVRVWDENIRMSSGRGRLSDKVVYQVLPEEGVDPPVCGTKESACGVAARP